jgi:hypothetical protein
VGKPAIDMAIAGILNSVTGIPHPSAYAFIPTTGISIRIGSVSLTATCANTVKVEDFTATANG